MGQNIIENEAILMGSKAQFDLSITNTDIPVFLHGDGADTIFFRAKFDDHGRYEETGTVGEIDCETLQATIGDGNQRIVISGDGWRDIHETDGLEDFIRRAMFGGEEAEQLLQEYNEELQVGSAIGVVLS
jgi:hypothetical protein